MKFNMIFLTFLFYVLCCNARADFFPICAYSCENLYQADSCNINTVQLPGGKRFSWLDSILNLADQLNMKIILSRAIGPKQPYHYNITFLSRIQYAVYEAESLIFDHDLGNVVFDTSASGKEAWAIASRKAGWVQHGLWTKNLYQYWLDTLTYFASFRLKTNNNKKTTPICKLCVFKKQSKDTEIKVLRILTGSDFLHCNKYEVFSLPFKMHKKEKGAIDFAIFYMGTGDSLYIDKIEIKDVLADSLVNGAFDGYVKQTARYYKTKPTIFRYYMQDEPVVTQFFASRKVNDLLKTIDPNKSGVQAILRPELFSPYLDSVNADEFFIECYPFWGKGCGWGERIPVDSGIAFQKRLDSVCNNILASARQTVKTHPGKKFWCIIQAFGNALTDSSFYWKNVWYDSIPYEDEGWRREPSPREMRCLVWLALTYGAKGICYWRYHSRIGLFRGQNDWVLGLTDTLGGRKKRHLWYTVKEINEDLKVLGDTLLTLESDTVFKSNNIPTNSYIASVSDSLVQVGTFHDIRSDYFILVNRRCLPTDTISINIGIRDNFSQEVYLYDYISEKNIFPFRSIDNIHEFMIRLLPGQGRFLKIVSKL